MPLETQHGWDLKKRIQLQRIRSTALTRRISLFDLTDTESFLKDSVDWS
ncbi:MAG: hypothetical protein GY904_10660 [Planctomycetaceae bacterium]|nr:hypothetical protein [Planctomycetaceae bacterium]